MSTIAALTGIEILDSRGNPTICVRVQLTNGVSAIAAVPSGASTGTHEAVEKRDRDSRYAGKGVRNVAAAVSREISPALCGMDAFDQVAVDQRLNELDGTPNKARLGANAILGASLAVARAAAQTAGMELYRYLGGVKTPLLPCPMFNILNGGAHAGNCLDFQEFMIRPYAAPSFAEGLRWGAEVYHTLKGLLKTKGLSTGVGDEGGFAPDIQSNEEAIEYILEAITAAGYAPGRDISIALDCAASELFDESTQTYVEKKRKALGKPYATRNSQEQVAYLQQLVAAYPIDSIEDGLGEADWSGWRQLTRALGDSIQIVGDDIFVTNSEFLRRGIAEKSANAILIKPNQIGTLTETIQTVERARRTGWRTVVSHRSGETEDTFIADLCVALGCGQIKTGAPCRSERVAKYNRLLMIEAFSTGLFLDTNRESLSPQR